MAVAGRVIRCDWIDAAHIRPALEPGYAEALPGHSHVFLSNANVDHHHSSTVDGAVSDITEEGGGVLALPSAENSGLVVVVVAVAFAALVLVIALTSLSTTFMSWVFRKRIWAINTIVPCAPPPKLFPY